MQIQQIPITSTDIANETLKDKHLSAILTALQNGTDLRAIGYKGREAEYSMADGCLTLGQRVVIPPKFRQRLLEDLHVAHIGIVKMKGLARSLIYWPSIDEDIERIAKCCEPCLNNAKMPPKTRSHHWEYPSVCWDRIHVDYADFLGKNILIVVDAYSKWMNVAITNSTTAKATCDVLEELAGRSRLRQALRVNSLPKPRLQLHQPGDIPCVRESLLRTLSKMFGDFNFYYYGLILGPQRGVFNFEELVRVGLEYCRNWL
ncbi:unnamed protein product, partial [Nesidiocoris tenuis]